MVRGDVTVALSWHPGGGGTPGAGAGSLSFHTAFLRGPCHRFEPVGGGGDGRGVVTFGKWELDGPHLDHRHRAYSRNYRQGAGGAILWGDLQEARGRCARLVGELTKGKGPGAGG